MKKYRFGAEMSFFRAKVYGIAQMCFVLGCHHSRRLKGNAQRVVKIISQPERYQILLFQVFYCDIANLVISLH